jgi:hypothetical protein
VTSLFLLHISVVATNSPHFKTFGGVLEIAIIQPHHSGAFSGLAARQHCPDHAKHRVNFFFAAATHHHYHCFTSLMPDEPEQWASIDSLSAVIDAQSRYGQQFALFRRTSHLPPFRSLGKLSVVTSTLDHWVQRSSPEYTFASVQYPRRDWSTMSTNLAPDRQHARSILTQICGPSHSTGICGTTFTRLQRMLLRLTILVSRMRTEPQFVASTALVKDTSINEPIL